MGAAHEKLSKIQEAYRKYVSPDQIRARCGLLPLEFEKEKDYCSS